MRSTTPLPGTNLVQLRARIGHPTGAVSGPVGIEKVVLVCDFDPPLVAPFGAHAREIHAPYASFDAPWEPNQRAASAFQVPQPGNWGAGLQVAKGPQRFGLAVTVRVNGSTEVVQLLADGSDRFELDWVAPRDYSLEAEVFAVDDVWRIAVRSL